MAEHRSRSGWVSSHGQAVWVLFLQHPQLETLSALTRSTLVSPSRNALIQSFLFHLLTGDALTESSFLSSTICSQELSFLTITVFGFLPRAVLFISPNQRL